MRRVPCCYKTAWENDEVCGFFEPGKQREVRMIENPDMCVVDATDDLSSERYEPCCDKGEWKPVGENLDGQLGRVKEVRGVYNCPPEEKDTQYEKTICYKSEWEDYGCRGKFRQQRRTVLNCSAGTSSTQEVEENRPQEMMDNCNNIRGVTSFTVQGQRANDYDSATITGGSAWIKVRMDGYKKNPNDPSKPIRFSRQWNSASSTEDDLKFDTPVDITYVHVSMSTYGVDSLFLIRFFNDDDTRVKVLSKYLKTKWYTGWDGEKRPTTKTAYVSVKKPMHDKL
jgi:hypothetical protein